MSVDSLEGLITFCFIWRMGMGKKMLIERGKKKVVLFDAVR